MKCMIEGIERAIRTLCNVGNADTMRKHNHKIIQLIHAARYDVVGL